MQNTIDILIQARDQATATIKRASASIDSFAEKNKAGMQAIGLASGVALTGIVALGTGALQQASKMQDLRQQFDTLTGSAEKGKGLFMEIQKVASQTPYDSEQLARATSTMLGFGVAQEKVMWSMKMLGDISLGNGERLQSLSLAFGQVQASGRLMGGDLLQMVNAGFNPLEAIAKRTGETMIAVKERMSAGGVSVNEVEQAMKDATSEGGRFFWGMEKASKTFSGVMSTLRDNIGITLASIGGFSNGEVVEGGLLDRLTDAMNAVMPYLERFSAWASENGTTIMIIGGIVWALSAMGVALASMGFIIPAITAWFATISAVIGAIWAPIIIAIWAITALWIAWSTNFLGIQDITKWAWDWIVETFNAGVAWIMEIIQPFLNEITVFWEENGKTIIEWLKIFWEVVKAIFSEWFEFLKLYLGTSWDIMVWIFWTAFELIKWIFKISLELLTWVLTVWMQLFQGEWSLAWETVKDTLLKIWNTIVDTWKAVFERLENTIKSIVERVENYVKWALVRIKDTLKEIVTLWNANTQTYNWYTWELKWELFDGARASGGPVRGGGTYLVGERWPELFTPRSSGSIVPNNALGGMSVSINFGGVSVRDDSDIQKISNLVTEEMTRKLRLYNLWIA